MVTTSLTIGRAHTWEYPTHERYGTNVFKTVLILDDGRTFLYTSFFADPREPMEITRDHAAKLIRAAKTQ